MELLEFYQLPIIDYIQIKVLSDDRDLYRTVHSKNNLIAELHNRILCFSLLDSSIQSNNARSKKVCCHLRIKNAVIHLTFSLAYIYSLSEYKYNIDKIFENNSFLQCYKADIICNDYLQLLEVDDIKNISSSNWYGGKVSKRCMFILNDEYFEHHDHQINGYCNPPSISSYESENMLLSLHSRDVVSSLLGSVDSVFGISCTNESKPINHSILLVGESGSGCSSLIHSIASKYSDLNIIDFSIGTILARSKTRMDLSSILVIKQEWLSTLMLATMYDNSLLILCDLHTLTPRIMPDQNAKTEEIIEMIYESLSCLFTGNDVSMLSYNNKKLLIVGRTYQEELVDERILRIFKEKVFIPSPSTKERRYLFRYVCKSYFNINNDLYNAYNIDSLSDNCSSYPMISLIHKAKQLIQNKVNLKTMNNTINNNSIKIDPFSHVAGHSFVKKILTETILWPRQYALLYHSYIRRLHNNDNNNNSNDTMSAISPVGILLFGPPGTGKTMLPRELSKKIGCTIINLGLVDVIRGEIGEGERRVNEIFKEAKRSAPCIIFIDEFQAIFTSRDDTSRSTESDIGSTLSSTLAGCFDDLNTWNKYSGHESLVTVIASTNEPWAIDRSFLRPNRLEKCIFVGPLDCDGREEFLRNIELSRNIFDEENIKTIVSLTDGFTGADMSLLIRKFEYKYNKENNNSSIDNVINIIKSMTPSVSPSEIKEYIDWQKTNQAF